MIRITRIDPPEELDNEMVEKLTNDFKADNSKIVWKKSYIKKSLLEMTNNKCAYCETSFDHSGSNMEVEHFFPKSLYPDQVVMWSNLLPSCKRCNGKKLNHDTKQIPIVNPVEQDPGNYFKLSRYRLIEKNELAEETINLLDLNSIDTLIKVRYILSQELYVKLKNCYVELQDIESMNDAKKIRRKYLRIRNIMSQLLHNIQPDKEYSAVLSSYFLSEEEYTLIKKHLIDNSFWDKELNKLEENAKKITLEIL